MQQIYPDICSAIIDIMTQESIQMINERNKYLRTALYLSVFTIFYNIIEGVLSVLFGAGDESLTLFGFGIDSFVEVISGLGIMHMIWRMKKNY